MITLRRGRERRHHKGPGREVWHTFDREVGSPFAEGFGNIESLDEDRIAPGMTLPLDDRRAAEVFTFVSEGVLGYEDSAGCAGVIRAGEFQHTTSRRGVSHEMVNASQTDWAHVFRIWLPPGEAVADPGVEQKRFTAAERRGRLLVVASSDARGGSLRIHQDAVIHASLLDPGHHVVHGLSPGRSAWIHVLWGEVTLGDVVLAAGDGAGVAGVRAISLTARREASILLIDVGERPPGSVSLTDTALFGRLWEETVEVLGPTATATILRRAARRALPRSPALAALEIARVEGEFRYSLPRSFDQPDARGALRELLDELRPLLAELTGQVVFRRLERVPQLREWASMAR
ncbi:MAG: pirin family protein [Anaeromyxobacteraceae bacterium]